MKKNKLLTMLLLVIVTISSSYGTIVEEDVIMYYDFKDSSIEKGIIQDKINNWDGIIQENIITGQQGNVDKAFFFDGSQTQQAFINISGNPLLNEPQGTFYTWLKVGEVPTSSRDGYYWMYFMVNQKGYDYSVAGHRGDFSCTIFWEFYLMFLNNPQFTSFQTYDSATECSKKTHAVRRSKVDSNPNGFLNDGEWHMWSVTWDGQNFNHYWDGELMGVYDNRRTVSWSQHLDDSNTHIGNFNTNIYNSFNGWIDELALFNRPLSQSEITELYNGGEGKTYEEIFELEPVIPEPTPEPQNNTDYEERFITLESRIYEVEHRVSVLEFIINALRGVFI